jgi:hypothetical protein
MEDATINSERRKSFSTYFHRKTSRKDGIEQIQPENFNNDIKDMEDYGEIDVGTLLSMEYQKGLEFVRNIDAKNKSYQRYMNQRIGSMRVKVATIKRIRRKMEEQALDPGDPPNYESEYVKLRERNSHFNCCDLVMCQYYLLLKQIIVIPYQLENDVDMIQSKLTNENIIEPHQIIDKANEIAVKLDEKIIDHVRSNFKTLIYHQKAVTNVVHIGPTSRRAPKLYPEIPQNGVPKSVWDSNTHA